ncbi:MAG: hypothetical protein KC646_08330 [Candidatus Cloacimonetes bacterium]|nr:hypothetical protein [Candidatus Cloacimonadota bacterium]
MLQKIVSSTLFLLILSYVTFIGHCADPTMDGLQGQNTSSDSSTQSRQKVDDLQTIGADYGSKAERKRKNWLKTRPIGQSLSLTKFIQKSNYQELLALDKVLVKLVSDKNEGTNYKEFFEHSEHTRKNWIDKGGKRQKLLSNYTLKEFEDLRTDGWFDKQSDTVDIYLTYNFMSSLRETYKELQSRKVQANMIKELYSQTHRLILGLLPTYNQSKNNRAALSKAQMDQHFLKPWAAFKEIDSKTGIKGFPWNNISSSKRGYSPFKEAFKHSASYLLYINLYKHHLRGVRELFSFSENQQVQDDLALLKSFHGKVNYSKIDGGDCLVKGSSLVKAFKKGRSLIYTSKNLVFLLYKSYAQHIYRASYINDHLLDRKARLHTAIMQQDISGQIQAGNTATSKAEIKNLASDETIQNNSKVLAQIYSVEGVILSEELLQKFQKQTDFTLAEFASTNGSEKELIQLLTDDMQGDFQKPEVVRERAKKISSAIYALSKDKDFQQALEQAKNTKAIDFVENTETGKELFDTDDKKITIKPEILLRLVHGDDAKTSNINLEENMSKAAQNLSRVEDVSSDLLMYKESLAALEKDFLEIGEDVETPSIQRYITSSKRMQATIVELSASIEDDLTEFEELKAKFQAVQKDLTSTLGLTNNEWTQVEFVESVTQWLKDKIFKEDLESQANLLFSKLSSLNAMSSKIQQLANKINKNVAQIESSQAKLLRYLKLSKANLSTASQSEQELKRKHLELYRKVSYHTSAQKDFIKKSAPMQASFDGSLANAFVQKYLVGFIEKGNTNNNYIKKINFHKFTQNSIVMDISYVETEEKYNMDTGEKEVTEKSNELSLELSPKVVKNKKNTFDFNILKLSMSDGSEYIEYQNELSILLNPLVAVLNSTPYKNLRFSFFENSNTLRVYNGIPILKSFPNFDIRLIELLSKKVFVYGGVSGKQLGDLVGSGLKIGGKESQSLVNTPATVESSEPSGETPVTSDQQDEPIASFPSEDELAKWDQVVEKPAEISGKVKVKVRDDLLNDFYQGFRVGIAKLARKENWPWLKKDVNSRLRNIFSSLNTVHLDFKDQGKLEILFKANLQTLSPETSSFYSTALSVISPYEGLKEGLAQGWSNVVYVSTIGFVDIKVDPNDYKVPSGAFALSLSTKSTWAGDQFDMKFDKISLMDPHAPGALQGWIKLAKLGSKAVRFAGDFKEGTLKALNYLPGVNFKIQEGNLDELLLSTLAGNIVSQMNTKIEDLQIDALAYDHYSLKFKYFSLVEGSKASIDRISITKGFFEIESSLSSD